MGSGGSKEQQRSMRLSYDQIPQSKGHVFYKRLQKLLRQEGLDAFLENLCATVLRRKARSQIHPAEPLFSHAADR